MRTIVSNNFSKTEDAVNTPQRSIHRLWYVLMGIIYFAGIVLVSRFLGVTHQESLRATLIPVIPAILGMSILRKNPGHTVGYLFLIMAFSATLLPFARIAYELNQLTPSPLFPIIENVTLIIGNTAHYPVIFIPLFLIPLYFPTGKLLSERWRLLVALVTFFIVWPFIATAIHPWPAPGLLDIEDTRILNGIPGSETIIGFVDNLTGPLFLPTPPLVILALVLRFRRASSVERKQMKLPIITISTILVLSVFVWLTPPLSALDSASGYIITWILVMMIPASFGIAILNDGLWEIDIIISRTLIYGGLSLAVVAIYATVVAGFGILFTTQANAYSGLIAAVIIGLLFQPLRNKLQQRVNHWIYGQRDDPVGMLNHLAQRLEAVDGPEHILPTLVETIASALKLPYVGISLRQDSLVAVQNPEKGWETVASSGQHRGQIREIPLLYQNEVIGRLDVAPRRPGESFTQEDEGLLATIAQLSATTVHAAQQTHELQRARQMLVTGREEERRRLRRDLHDGLGPVMASVALQADTAHDLVDSDRTETKAILDSIMNQAQSAVSDVRRLVYGLRPPTLDELGLVGALRQAARPYQSKLDIRILENELPPLPAAVEVAAYHIALEAMNNVAKHAQAHTCTVTISLEDKLRLVIEDDGIGLAPNTVPGVGFISMKERAIELSGVCTIQQGSSGGTIVEVELPLLRDKRANGNHS